MKARELGLINGQKVFSFPAIITSGQIAALHQINFYPKTPIKIIARNAAEAMDWLRSKLEHIPCIEIEVFGPKGGVAKKAYWGFERAIFNQMIAERPTNQQLTFNL